jgi:hypothetical protein
VTPLVLGENPDQIVAAALSASGDLWIPARFSGDPMTMPTCPGNFIFPVPLEIGGGAVIGRLASNYNPLSTIRGVVGYLGDEVIGGTDFYGMLYPQRINLVHVADTLGVCICRLNDAVDLVLQVKGASAWAQSRSPFRFVAWGSQPILLQLFGAQPVPASTNSSGSTTMLDSFGNDCSPRPSSH